MHSLVFSSYMKRQVNDTVSITPRILDKTQLLKPVTRLNSKFLRLGTFKLENMETSIILKYGMTGELNTKRKMALYGKQNVDPVKY